MKVYVIMKGEYSDRHVVGVTIDEEKAEKIADAVSDRGGYGYGDARVVEYDTDEFETMRIRYTATWYEDGEWVVESDTHGEYATYTENCILFRNTYLVYAENREQALKIAQDMRAQELAKENGIC